MSSTATNIYSATYSNVPVYEFNIDGNHVMRRRSDDWINATHILKVADYDKPTRTRILEREVQKNIHEKVQGGYGKYQGTWIPLPDGRALAEKNGVLERLLPIFEFVPGDRSPPPAPKHATAASRPRAPKAAPARKPQPRAHIQAFPPHPPPPPMDFERMDISMHDMATPDNESVIASESAYDDFDASHYTGSRKRRRMDDYMSQSDREHQLWAEELLDYFMLQEGGDALPNAPEPPMGVNLNRPIDERGHTALHWAAAMADVEVVKTLISRGASIDAQSKNGETPLMRSVLFTNSFDKSNMERLASLLIRTVNMQEWSGCTVFHVIAGITHSKKKYDCARYYMDCILSKMAEVLSPSQITTVLNEQDRNGDTAINIAARNGARKCIRSLIGRHAAVDIPNHLGETADHLIVRLNERRRERSRQRDLSSSPFRADPSLDQLNGGAVQALAHGLPLDLLPHTALERSSQLQARDFFKSETALALTAHVMPVIVDKAKSLAREIDVEIAEKDAELAEAERVITMRRAEREQLQREREKLETLDREETQGLSEMDDRLGEELDMALRWCQQLTEEVENVALRDLIASQQSDQAASNSIDTKSLDGHGSALVEEKLQLARDLVRTQQQRDAVIAEMVQHLAAAGFGKRQTDFKKLITGALLVREEDLDKLLPDIVRELEDTHGMEQAGA